MNRTLGVCCYLTSVVLLLVSGGQVFAQGPSDAVYGEPTALWEWFEKEDPREAQDYIQLHPPGPFSYSVISAPGYHVLSDEKIVLIIVNTSLRSSIQSNLDVYESDLVAFGYDVAIVEAEGGTQQDLKALIEGYYADWGASLNGCVLIGELPIPWFRHINDWDGNPAEFPCDLYYADMDGTWGDADGNGIPDSHTDGSGDTMPEMWIGRVTAHDMSEDETTLVNSFFEKNHLYRECNAPLPRRALLYQDDDWATLSGWYNAFGALLGDRDWIQNTETTNASDYDTRFDDEYQWMLVCAHSNPGLHAFRTSSGNTYYYVADVMAQNPYFNFCITFACSNANYSYSDYMSGWYLFAGDYTQLVLGSTKTGGFYYGTTMFAELESHQNIGDSYKEWFCEMHPYSDGEIAWFYGLTLLGDPTLYVPSDTYIDLVSFEAKPLPTEVELSWETASEVENAGFVLFRSRDRDGSDAIQVSPGMIPSDGTLTAGAHYVYKDLETERGVKYYYWLIDVDTDGRWTTHGPASARVTSFSSGLRGTAADHNGLSVWTLGQ